MSTTRRQSRARSDRRCIAACARLGALFAAVLVLAPPALADTEPTPPTPPQDETRVPGDTTAPAPEPAATAPVETAPPAVAPVTPAGKRTVVITLEPLREQGAAPAATGAGARQPVDVSRFEKSGGTTSPPDTEPAPGAARSDPQPDRAPAPARAAEPEPAEPEPAEPTERTDAATKRPDRPALAGATVSGARRGAVTGAAAGKTLASVPGIAVADGARVAASTSSTGVLAVGLLAFVPGGLLLLLAALVPALGRWRRIPPYRWAGIRFTAVTIGVAWLLASIVIVVAL